MAASPASKIEKTSSEIIIALAVSTLIGLGGGASLGFLLGVEAPSSTAVADKPAEAHAAPKVASEKPSKSQGAHAAVESPSVEAAGRPKMGLKELPPIVTNLAAPETGWVRLQAAIVYDPQAVPQPDILVSQVTADVVAFLRTLSLASIQGGDGLRRLHEDLTERASIRSEGRIREFIIQALVVQ